jgi:hypothetical protein
MMLRDRIKEDDKKPKPSELSRGSYPTLEVTAEGLNIGTVIMNLISYPKALKGDT